MNYKKSKFSLIFRVIALVLLQAFLVMDIVWAAGGDLFASEGEVTVSTLAPKLQLDAQSMKGVFLNSIDDLERTTELTAVDKSKLRSNRIGVFSLETAKKLVVAATLFIVLIWPFASPALTEASQKQAQAPPAITLEQKQFKNSLINISKKSGYKQLNDAGEITTIRVNLKRQGENLVFSHGKARDRVEQVNKLIDKIWLSSFVKGDLDEYITKRGDSPEAIAIGKALLFLKIADPETFEVLKSNDVPIYMGELYNYNGYTRGRRFFGILGDPMMFINDKFIQNPFNIAMVFAHEGYHVEFDSPKDIWESISHYNILTLLSEVFSGIPPNEQAAFKQQKEFVEFINIVPIEGDYFYDAVRVAYAYRGNKMQNLFLDGVGTVMYNIIPLGAGALLVFLIVKTKQNRTPRGRQQRTGGSVLSWRTGTISIRNDRSVVKRARRTGNRFKSIILLPFLALLGSLDFFNPEVSLAGGFDQIVSEGSGMGLIIWGGILVGSLILSAVFMRERAGVSFNDSGDSNTAVPEIITLPRQGEGQSVSRLKRYINDSALENCRAFVLDFVKSSKDASGKAKEYNESRCNRLLNAVDVWADYLPFTGNNEQIKRLLRIAIYMKDLGYFDESADSELLAERFMNSVGDEFSELDIEVVMYLIGKPHVEGNIPDVFNQDAADDDRAYRLLSDFKADREWKNVSGKDMDANFIKGYTDKNFPDFKIWKKEDSDLIMNAILGGKVIAYADAAGIDASAGFPEQILKMDSLFSADELMPELIEKIETVKENPAAGTMSQNMESFIPLDGGRMPRYKFAEDMVGASI